MAAADALGIANTIAARATTAYLIGRGLAAQIDDARFPEDGGPIPAPHLDELVSELGITAAWMRAAPWQRHGTTRSRWSNLCAWP